MKDDQRGQTLVEVIIIVVVSALMATGLIFATTNSLRASQSGRLRSKAAKYAQEAVESARHLRNANWNEFVNYNGSYCLDSSLVWEQMPSCPYSIDNIFSRIVNFNYDGIRMMVTVAVSWHERGSSGVQQSVKVVTYFTNWR